LGAFHAQKVHTVLIPAGMAGECGL
jgi:hypothetical protein